MNLLNLLRRAFFPDMDFNHEPVHPFYLSTVPDPYEIKRAEKIEDMGDKYICHKSNQVQRIYCRKPVLDGYYI